MNISLVIKHRLDELNLEQRDLATAAQVTESYISQLLTRKKAPPAPNRTDIYDKIGKFLKLPNDELARLADIERQEQFKRKLADPPAPLFKEIRELILRKCSATKQREIQGIFEKQPFGELERLITQKLLDVAKRVAKQELQNENWLRLVARISNRSYEEMRVILLEFLDADVFDVSIDNCVPFLNPLIDSWDVDLFTFGVKVVINRRVAAGDPKIFEFVERDAGEHLDEEPGLTEFLHDPSLRCNATEEEIEFLKQLRFKGKRPTSLYYYRELQNLRDPLHFRQP